MKILRRSIDEVNQHSDTITSYCRYLMKEGYEPDWRLEVYRKGRIDDPDVIVKNIGEAAKLTVREDPSPHFAPFKKMSAEKEIELANKRREKRVRAAH